MKFAIVSTILAAAAAVSAVSVQQLPLPFDEEIVSTLAAPTRPVPGNSPIAVCDIDDSQILDLKYLKIDPNPPLKGAELYIEGEGYLDEQIDDGAFVEIEVRYGFIRLVKETIDLCEQLEKADGSCPVEKGPIKFSNTVELPNEIPPGKYNVISRAYKADYKLISCLTATVEFPRN
ncbi:ML domain-containing protein [Lipomyces tetrasporus]|uniref:Phosphatidylglycerol/phosphatidylinositol transfer protein n=1 Tax=Lipomyces tetrasporus TaxID=54092 RepID=A0AAD7QR23_9ASCO|nr:ML domain-containing protein [Lipomyces tetrasporus]KAJ8099723.1 ML domain-containing protein [Lipomyces tetrasporus]